MGNTTPARVNNVNQNLTMNKTDIDILNKNVNSFISNTAYSAGQKCGASAIANQSFDARNWKAHGDITINGLNLKQMGIIDLTCSQKQEAMNQSKLDLYQSIMDNLKNNNSSEVLSEMEAAAKTAVKNGWGAIGPGSADTDANNLNYNINKSDIHQELRNIVKNSIEANYDVKVNQECQSNLSQDQTMSFYNIEAGGGIQVSGVTQDQVVNSFSKCLQDQHVGQEITNNIISAIGVEVVNENTNKSNTKQKGVSDSTTINNGPFESVGEMWGSIFSGIGTAVSNGGSCSKMCGVILIIIAVIAVLILLFVGVSKMKKL